MLFRLSRRCFADVASHAPGKIPKVIDKIVWLNVEDSDGTKHVVPGIEGENLMFTLRKYSVPIPGTCDGADKGVPETEDPRDYLSAGPYCNTCQVIIEDPWHRYLKPMGGFEHDRIVRVDNPTTPNTRLSCVLLIEKWMNGMHIFVPYQVDERPDTYHNHGLNGNRDLDY